MSDKLFTLYKNDTNNFHIFLRPITTQNTRAQIQEPTLHPWLPCWYNR